MISGRLSGRPLIMRGMVNRKGQQQPMRKGQARIPGPALAAALAGRAAPGMASGAMDQTRALAKNAGSLAGVLAGASAVPRPGGPKAKPKPKPRPAATVGGSLADQIKEQPKVRTYSGEGTNTTQNERAGRGFREFTKPDRPGLVFHEYTNPDGTKTTVAVKRKPQSA